METPSGFISEKNSAKTTPPAPANDPFKSNEIVTDTPVPIAGLVFKLACFITISVPSPAVSLPEKVPAWASSLVTVKTPP